MQHDVRETIAGISLSHPKKVLFDSQGLTKADIARHYERVADRMLPGIKDRLISLVRCPDGQVRNAFSRNTRDGVSRRP